MLDSIYHTIQYFFGFISFQMRHTQTQNTFLNMFNLNTKNDTCISFSIRLNKRSI